MTQAFRGALAKIKGRFLPEPMGGQFPAYAAGCSMAADPRLAYLAVLFSMLSGVLLVVGFLLALHCDL